jgi:4-amino-4-deoxy-L-arabinose transferase-like glycosyltransferase
MLETGDFIEIRFQDRARNKKPVGVSWMQAASAQIFGGPEGAKIWAYRLPSMLAAILSVLAMFWVANRAIVPPAGLVAGALLTSTLLVVGEANIAKTDAMLFLCVLAAEAALLHLYLSSSRSLNPALTPALIFWAALGLGTLIKGPVILMIVGLTVVSLCIADRKAAWLKPLKPFLGIPLFLAIILPWGIAVWMATDGTFFAQAVGEDFAPKLLSGQESHGAPPGYYLLAVSLTLWPAALFLWPSLIVAWTNRTDPLVRFCLAWAVPSWIIFELVPTKLPHYILPLYPALILIITWALTKTISGRLDLSNLVLRVSLGIWILLGVILSAAIVALPENYGGTAGLLHFGLAGICILFIGGTAFWTWQKNFNLALIGAVLTGLVFTVGLLEGAARQIPDLNVSPKLVAALGGEARAAQFPLASAGYTEPSLVFLTRTDTHLGKGADVAQFLIDTPLAIAIVEAREQPAFLDHLLAAGRSPQPFGEVSGINYSRGDEVTLTLYKLVLKP